jgi:hypothetical protein
MKIYWIRVVAAAFLLEVALVAVTIPLLAVVSMQTVVPYVGPLCAIVALPFGWWAARKAQSGFALHGMLVGVVATMIYLGLILRQNGTLKPALDVYGPYLFFLANAAKIAGCIAGAFACGRRKRNLSGAVTESDFASSAR